MSNHTLSPGDTTRIDLPSGSIEYTTLGPADSAHPPVVFVHGFLVDHRLWSRVAELLAAAGHRCYLPDLPLGAHRLPWGADHDRSPRGAATLVREFVAALDLTDATVVSNDTGGAITQYAVDADPEFAGRLVFTNCDGFDLFPPQPFRFLFALLGNRAAVRPLIAATAHSRLIRHSPLGVGLLLNSPDPEFTRSFFEPARADARIRDDITAFLGTIDPADLNTVTGRMGRVRRPVAFVWGADDRCFTTTHGRRLAATFADATFTLVPSARTFVSLDQPAAVADAVADIARRRVFTPTSGPGEDS
ncbi:alpha/beta hydrolase [Gordonia sp. ABSL1-1]|uniref:alpha/beta fold hydrolase n=1 Tax=Gordonia sp. ABSL1-1 TaxID=3053923 RepID=UPI00257246AD|nr:alpha/beta hydrolase [Gordonia sp. ABSL1-1]MDL9936838.1 alpha/beta hydrolase [Gordonia sp. ABSL1-1]